MTLPWWAWLQKKFNNWWRYQLTQFLVETLRFPSSEAIPLIYVNLSQIKGPNNLLNFWEQNTSQIPTRSVQAWTPFMCSISWENWPRNTLQELELGFLIRWDFSPLLHWKLNCYDNSMTYIFLMPHGKLQSLKANGKNGWLTFRKVTSFPLSAFQGRFLKELQRTKRRFICLQMLAKWRWDSPSTWLQWRKMARPKRRIFYSERIWLYLFKNGLNVKQKRKRSLRTRLWLIGLNYQPLYWEFNAWLSFCRPSRWRTFSFSVGQITKMFCVGFDPEKFTPLLL